MPTTDPSGSLRERIAACQGRLSAAERKVAGYLADFPENVAFSSAGQLGTATETSDATVIRTVKALGYSGLPALRKRLQEDVRERLTPAGRLGQRLEATGVEPDAVLHQVLEESVALLREAQRSVRPEAFGAAVRLLTEARSIVVLGTGGLGVLGRLLAMRLTRLRRPARSATSSGFLLADDLLGLTPDDLLVVVAHGTVPAEVDVALNHAARVGVQVLLITDNLGPLLADRVSVYLTAPIGSSRMFSVQATTVAVLDALVLAVAAGDREHALDAMRTMFQLREELRPGRDRRGS